MDYFTLEALRPAMATACCSITAATRKPGLVLIDGGPRQGLGEIARAPPEGAGGRAGRRHSGST